MQKILRHIWPDRISQDDLVDEMDRALRIPGTTNAWTMPIRNRVDMLTTGVRTPVGVKVLGADLNKIQEIGEEIEHTLAQVPGTRSVYAERVSGGYFLDFNLRRDQLARYGLTVDDVEAYIMSGVGGENVTTTVEGRERYSVNVRYLRDYRSDVGSLERVLVATPSGAQIPISQLADIRLLEGPSMIRDENGLLSGYVYVDVAGRDLGSYVEEAQRLVRAQVEPHLPAGYSLSWSGQYEFLQRVRERLKLVVPITIFLVFILLYLNTQVGGEDADHLRGRAVFGGGRHLAAALAGLQHEHRRLGGLDRLDGRGRGDRRLHAALSRSRLRKLEAGRAAEKL